MARGTSRSPVEKALTAALYAYRKADYKTDQAFTAFEKDCERARQKERDSPTFIIADVAEPIRKAYLIAEARALSHIAEVAADRARTSRRNL